MIEFRPHDYRRAEPVLAPLAHLVPLCAVFEGTRPARVFVDNEARPAAAFVWNEWGHYYLAGEPGESFAAELGQVMTQELIPAAKALGETGPVLHFAPEPWEEHRPAIVPGHQVFRLYRRGYSSAADHLRDRFSSLLGPPTGFRLTREDHPHGFTFRLLEGETVVSECGSCFRAGRRLEIGVFTAEAHRRRGFAALTGAAFVTACLDEGWEPCWTCFADNEGSLRLAQRLGFVEPVDSPIWAWSLLDPA